MAYGKTQMKPGSSREKIKPLNYPETKKIQQGKTGQEGAQIHDYGIMPSSGNFEGNAGMSGGAKGGHTVQGAMKGAGGKGDSMSAGPMDRGGGSPNLQTKKPAYPGSHGGANTGSIDTMTKLIFHPKGGMGTGKGRKSPQQSGKFKDSGQRQETAKKVAGVSL